MDFDSNPPELEANNKCDLENCRTQTILSHLLGSAFFFPICAPFHPGPQHSAQEITHTFLYTPAGGVGVLVFITTLIDQYYNNR